jgi:hypothetical protein
MNRDRPFPNHSPFCPFQVTPIGLECICGAAEEEFHAKFHSGVFERCVTCHPIIPEVITALKETGEHENLDTENRQSG